MELKGEIIIYDEHDEAAVGLNGSQTRDEAQETAATLRAEADTIAQNLSGLPLGERDIQAGRAMRYERFASGLDYLLSRAGVTTR